MLKRKNRLMFILVPALFLALRCLFIFLVLPSRIGYMYNPYWRANSNAKLTYTNTAIYITKCEAAGIQVPDMAVCGWLEPKGERLFDGTPNGLDQSLKDHMGGFLNAGYYYVKIKDGLPIAAYWSIYPSLILYSDSITKNLEDDPHTEYAYAGGDTLGGYPNAMSYERTHTTEKPSKQPPQNPVYDFSGMKRNGIEKLIKEHNAKMKYDLDYFAAFYDSFCLLFILVLFAVIYPFCYYNRKALEHNAEAVRCVAEKYFEENGFPPDGMIYSGRLTHLHRNSIDTRSLNETLCHELGNSDRNYYIIMTDKGKIKVWFSGRKFSKHFLKAPREHRLGTICI